MAIADGIRESTESWADVLRDLRRRGMRAPTVAVGDGALGFWAALREVFPETVEARCSVHKAANVLSALPKSVQPAARKALAAIRDAEDREHARAAIKDFDRDSSAATGRTRRSPRDPATIPSTGIDYFSLVTDPRNPFGLPEPDNRRHGRCRQTDSMTPRVSMPARTGSSCN